MSILITFLTLVLVANCLVLMLLVLIQLPKKEAGAGLAFGGGATDALFGSGSGNALTKLTKYAGITFVALCLVLSMLNQKRANSGSSLLKKELLKQQQAATAAAAAAPAKPASQFMPLQTAGSNLLTTPPAAPATPAPAPAAPK